MSLICWNCNNKIDTSGINCPHCNALIDQALASQNTTFQTASFHIRNSPASPITPGIVVAERYDVKREIGRGGMGIVYLAHDNYMDRDVALKIIPQELSMDPKAIADLKRETSLALELTHEFIVRLYNLDTWRNLTFVTMEYVPGGTLSHLMVKNGGRLSLDQALPLLHQIAQGLDYTHRKSPPVMHLDIKPLNILISKEGQAKIADYGLARVLRDLATRISAWEAAGTLAYMAPEQIRGKGIGPWSDIYALAAVAYELLSGHPPFHTGDLRWQIMHEEVEEIEFIPKKINAALLFGLNKKPEHRPASAEEFVAVLAGEKPIPKKEEAKTGREERQAKPGGPEAMSQPLKAGKTDRIVLRKWGLGWVGFFLIVLAGVAGWFYLQKPTVRQKIVATESKGGPAMIPKPVEEKPPMVTPQPEPIPEPVAKKIEAPPAPMPAPAAQPPAAEPTGVLPIQSDPEGAIVYVDGAVKGTTPLTLEALKAGKYEIKITKDGFGPWIEQITYAPDNGQKLTASLPSLQGELEITSTPEGALVFIDGKEVGQTPLVVKELEIGKKRIAIEAEGYEKWVRQIKVARDEVTKIKAELMESMGDLRVVSDPAKAEVYLAGERKGLTPILLKKQKIGPVMLELRKDCFQTEIKEVVVEANRAVEARFKLTSNCASLVVNSQPPGAKWYMDGEYRGVTPANVAGVVPGEHTIKMVLDKHKEQMITVNLKNGGRETVLARLESEIADSGSQLRDPVTGMEFVSIPKGCFNMGSDAADPERNVDEGPLHEVCVEGFLLGRFEVTQGQWQKVMQSNPATLKTGDNYPVVNVSWNDIQAFVKKLNEANSGKYVFRLPTEAEWEYACRSGGKAERYAGGNTADGPAWHEGNSERSFHPVGKKTANGLGLHDMSGNVFEWVEDVYASDAYSQLQKDNPVKREGGKYRVCRGGSWLMKSGESRTTNRSYYYPDSRNYNLGFRLVRTP